MKIIFIILVFIFSCSRPHTEQLKQDKIKIDLKNRETPEGNQLVSDREELKNLYSGSLLVWNEETIIPSDLAQVMKLSEVTQHKIVDEHLYDQEVMQPLRLDEKRLAIQIEELQKELNLKSFSVRFTKAKNWLAEKALDENTQKILDQYCDAILWQFTFSEMIANGIFKERPFPLVMCEKFYEGRKYFLGSACAEDSNGKNYFQCLFQEGVLLTSYTKRLKEEQFESLKSISSEDWLKALQNIDWRVRVPKIMNMALILWGDGRKIDLRYPDKKSSFGADAHIDEATPQLMISAVASELQNEVDEHLRLADGLNDMRKKLNLFKEKLNDELFNRPKFLSGNVTWVSDELAKQSFMDIIQAQDQEVLQEIKKSEEQLSDSKSEIKLKLESKPNGGEALQEQVKFINDKKLALASLTSYLEVFSLDENKQCWVLKFQNAQDVFIGIIDDLYSDEVLSQCFEKSQLEKKQFQRMEISGDVVNGYQLKFLLETQNLEKSGWQKIDLNSDLQKDFNVMNFEQDKKLELVLELNSYRVQNTALAFRGNVYLATEQNKLIGSVGFLASMY